MSLNPFLTFTILAVALIIILIVAWFWRSGKVRQEPQFELEKLTNCRSCGSLIPEGVRRCAFCGAWQQQQASGEQIKS